MEKYHLSAQPLWTRRIYFVYWYPKSVFGDASCVLTWMSSAKDFSKATL